MKPIPSRPVLVVAPLLALALALATGGCASRGETAAAHASASVRSAIDLPAFMGTWYVVARIPNMIERGHMSGRLDYTLADPARVGIIYTYRTGPREEWRRMQLNGAIQPGSGGRDWRVRFFRLVPTTQRILEVDPNGQWALLDSPDRDLAWIFSRDPQIDEATYRDLRERLRGHGIDVNKVWRVAQSPEQVGQRGFDQPNRP